MNWRFDLSRGPLLRGTLVALADDEHILVFTIHRMVFDRWSKRVLAMELKELYGAYVSGRTPSIGPLVLRSAVLELLNDHRFRPNMQTFQKDLV